MKLKNGNCNNMPICDFCVFFDSESAFDKGGANVAKGLCFKYSKMVDPSYECNDFVCKCCAKERFCRTVRQDQVGEHCCKGYVEDDEVHPMCIKCYQWKEELVSFINMDNVETNQYGVNAKIKANILSDREMQLIGFEMQDGKWRYYRDLNGKDEIGLCVIINAQDANDLDIQVLDEDFCQPYNYQRILNHSNNEYALKIKELVEQEIDKLQNVGVLSGHVVGECI